MRKNVFFYVGVMAVASLIGCKATPETGRTFLFVQVAESGSLVPLDAKAGTYRLELARPSRIVTYFSDRPVRLAGSITLDQYLTAWQKGADSFDADPPNAALSIGETGQVVVLTLSKPQMVDGALRYTARRVDEPDKFTWGSKAEKAAFPESFGEASLFIDNVTQIPQAPIPENYVQSPAIQHGVPRVVGPHNIWVHQGWPQYR